MTSREHTMALVIIGLFILGGGAFAAYQFVYSPLQDKAAEASKLEAEIAELDTKISGLEAARSKIAEMKRQSLPLDVNQAKTEYKLMLERLLQHSRFVDYKIPDARTVEKRPPVTPDLLIPIPGSNPPNNVKKPAYTTLEFRIDIKKADIWQVVDFLQAYYRLDLLHQITELTINRENKATDPRNGLEVHITCEAIIIDQTDQRPQAEQEAARRKADPRPALFPVGTAVAAIGGNPSVQAVALKVEVARHLTPATASPVLASKTRDYSFIPLMDIFYGPIPPEKVGPAFALGRIDDVTIKKPEEPSTVKVQVSGEGSTGAKVVATATGKLLPEGPLSVDPKTLTITIPQVTEELGSRATSTVSVVATSSDGKVQKRSFDVAMGKAPFVEEKSPGPDISSAIKLIMVSGDSHGTMKAVIFDAASPFKYQISADAKSVEVVKWWSATNKTWKKDLDYEQPDGVLAFSDDFSSTKRTFKVIAIEAESLLLVEITKHDAAKADAKQPGKGFGRPPGGFGPPAKQGSADPMAAFTGNAPLSLPVPVMYRWTLGKSLKELKDGQLTADEARKIHKRIAIEGHVGPSTVSAGN